ncbi:hypothetical protein [Pseudomonas phage Kat]|uniref:Uncharacterized protein n=2 Tax=Pakpunavirus TaxID=1921407 RepID=A0A9E7DQ16_9CAUD|nr:hypothetical protein QE330_gp119 [Pseudomonas phage vB_Pae_Kat]UQS93487.1 hypothetical protein Kat_gp079 [Pseudomonas phage vB_Pae_Kat]WNV48845.1 hypothetical protein [Pseudomonas phage Kat]
MAIKQGDEPQAVEEVRTMQATYQALKTLRDACEAAKDEKGTINGNKLNSLRNKAVKEMQAGGETYSDAISMAHDLIKKYRK